ncbi:hypothetical protein BDZ90DRAFT_232512 [Jaminaea rosea]|uniref:Amino acid transporter transmembrane domain-containing protein n=1 Tax=Jaminaea rosea TaxID=1569628 RepID=A0A316UQF9_9BASI|nr:hypothetical protein BDZ90DRAFT_232512 [Jaminaea rosea]PWN27537.1 hypothetical protein BDZ90DRAFT_232512 [Jaminaea rosea]
MSSAEKASAGGSATSIDHAHDHDHEGGRVAGPLTQAKRGDLGDDAYVSDEAYERAVQGKEAMHQLGWVKMATLLCVEAIALGSLSLPGAFATLGMVGGVLLTVGTGVLATYTGWICGQVYLFYPGLKSFPDAGRQLFSPLGPRWARFGYELVSVLFVAQLTLNYASHALTGSIMWQHITDRDDICSIIWVLVSAVMLTLLASPPTFEKFSFLGYVDFVSIIIAILIVMIATGVSGPTPASDWSAWPQPGTTFVQGFAAVTNVLFAYAFVIVQFSLQTEMKNPKDVTKSVIVVGGVQILVYTLTGALIYAFVGQSVESPAILSAGSKTIVRVAFGIAMPVIFISGSINANAVARYVHHRIYSHSRHQYINTGPGWLLWIAILAVLGVVAFVVAEAIPFFSDLLGIISSLLISAFTLWLPSVRGLRFTLMLEAKLTFSSPLVRVQVLWYFMLRQGAPLSRQNLIHTLLCLVCFIYGVTVLGVGTYANVDSIVQKYTVGKVRSAFSCAPL